MSCKSNKFLICFALYFQISYIYHVLSYSDNLERTMNSYYNQQTIAEKVTLSGTGVHSGKKTNLTIRPAKENHGIKFRRLDLPGTPDIPALFKLVVDTSLATVIGHNGAIVSTIEHLMASFVGLGIDNALVEVDDYEMPIMDGSAREFTRAITRVGVVEQKMPRQLFIVNEPIEIIQEDKWVRVEPAPCFKISCTIEFDHPLIGLQKIVYDQADNNFEQEVCGARTFGFVKDLEMLKKFSLGKGGSLDNAIVIDQDKILNEGGLRYPDEFVRHKLLDCLGDFSLLGMPIQGHITTHKSGHHLNHLFIKKFLDEKQAWETGPVKR